MARQPSHPPRPKDVGRERSGKKADSIKAGGLTRTVYRCPCHGQAFDTRPILGMHVRQYRARLRKDFAGLVKDGNLGQDAWARLPGETAVNYNRFMVYLKMTNRSLVKVASIVGRSKVMVGKTASQWSWALRAEIWDRRIEADALAQFEVEKRQSARKQARLGRKLQDVAMAGASSLLINAERLDEMSGNEIAKLADIGTKIERLANSDPTSITDDRGQVRLVWEGPKPAWAPEPRQIEATIERADQATIDQATISERVRAFTTPKPDGAACGEGVDRG